MARRGQHRHAPRLPHADRGGDVLAEEDLLEGHRLRLVPANQLTERLVKSAQPLLDTHVPSRLDHTAVESHHPLPDGADHTEPGVRDTRIDADDDHAPSFSNGGRMSFYPVECPGGQDAAAAFSRISSGTSK